MHPLARPPREICLLLAVLALVLAALAGPPLAQWPDYHALADQLPRWGMPHALDVLSNLSFAAAGAACLFALRRAGVALGAAECSLVALTGLGLLVTAAGSTWYHWAPDDARLVVDRCSMVLPFAGLLGLAGLRVSSRAGLALAAAMLVAAPLAVRAWAASGNLWPWAVAQGGGAVLLLALAAVARPAALPVRWGAVFGLYALSKLCEGADHVVWTFTDGAMSGHALKHVVAALAVLPVVAALARVATYRQNCAELPARAAC